MKKIFSILLVLTLSFTTMTTAFGQTNNLTLIDNIENDNVQKYKEYTVDDILKLEPYVYVTDGHFKIDSKKAIKDGIELSLIQGQQEYFNTLNQQANKGKIAISKNLAIEEKTVSKNLNMVTSSGVTATASKCKGITSGPKSYWWGYKSWANSCDTKTLIKNANTVAAAGGLGSAGLGTLGVFFPVLLAPAGVGTFGSAYFWLFATRLDANNKGKGVIVEMTWAAVYDISPQY